VLSGSDVNSLETTKLYVVNVNSGVYYQFKYRARNVHGEGQDSPTVTVLAGTVPHQMNQPVLSLQPGPVYRIAL
jgi:hypothetical protein